MQAIEMQTTLGHDIDKDAVARAYDRWAPVYDLVFGAVFERGRMASIKAAEDACPAGGRILEVGVGTGISLPDYSNKNRITGVDISPTMLRKAQDRVKELGLKHVEGLAVMDAADLQFEDNSFDVVVAQYVVTTVPDPEGTLDEFARKREILKGHCAAIGRDEDTIRKTISSEVFIRETEKEIIEAGSKSLWGDSAESWRSKALVGTPEQVSEKIQRYLDGGVLTIYDHPWPGFTPDLLSIVLVVATQAKGTVLVHQKMFESRLFFWRNLNTNEDLSVISAVVTIVK